MSRLLKKLATAGIKYGVRPPEALIDRYLELTHLREFLTQAAIDCVLDVGANRGQFARELRQIGYEGWIISFEPVSTEFAALARSFAGDRKWKGYQLALAQQNGTATINVHPNTVFSSFLETTGKSVLERRETIETKRLDGMFVALLEICRGTRILLKMDTQGYDLEVFRGATGCLSHIQGLLSEISIVPIYKGMPHYLEALTTYKDAGFELVTLSAIARSSEGSLMEMNCLMKRA